MAKISIVIPVYNVEEYLKDCLDSLVTQTLDDIEIICVNDCSTDGSLDILHNYQERYNNIKIINNQHNMGVGNTRNIGLDYVSGEYLLFVDPDDYIAKNSCEILYNKAKDVDADVLRFNYIEFSNNNVEMYRNSKKRYKGLITHDVVDYIDTVKNKNKSFSVDFHVWNRIYKSSFIKNNNIRFATTRIGEDNLFVISSIVSTKKVYFIYDYLYFYRFREISLVNSYSDKNFDVFENIEQLKAFFIEKGCFAEYNAIFDKYCIDRLYWHYNLIPLDNREIYLNKAKNFLNNKNYKKLLMNIKNDGDSFFERIFSIKNKKENGKKTKYIKIFGMVFELKKASKST